MLLNFLTNRRIIFKKQVVIWFKSWGRYWARVIRHRYCNCNFYTLYTTLDLRLAGHGLESRQLKSACSRGCAMASSPHATPDEVCWLVMWHLSLVSILAIQWLRLILLGIQQWTWFSILSSVLKNLEYLFLQLHEDSIQFICNYTLNIFHELDHRIKITHDKMVNLPP